MSEVQSGDLEQAKAALQLARAYHDGAMLAARHKPQDHEVQRRVQDAVQQGKEAWDNYVRAITAESGVQNMPALPGVLPNIPLSFREE